MDLKKRMALARTLFQVMCFPHVSTQEVSMLNSWKLSKVRSDFSALRQAGYLASAEHTCPALPHPVPRHWVTDDGITGISTLSMPREGREWVSAYSHIVHRLLPRLDSVAVINNLCARLGPFPRASTGIRYGFRREPLDALVKLNNDNAVAIICQGAILPRGSLRTRIEMHLQSRLRGLPLLVIVPTPEDCDEALQSLETHQAYVAVEDVALHHDRAVWRPASGASPCTLAQVRSHLPTMPLNVPGAFPLPPRLTARGTSMTGIERHPMVELALRPKRALKLMTASKLMSRPTLLQKMQETVGTLDETALSKVTGPLLGKGLIVSEHTDGVTLYDISNIGTDFVCRAQRASGPDAVVSPQEVPLLSRRDEWEPGQWGRVLRGWERNRSHGATVRGTVDLLHAEAATSRWTLDSAVLAPETQLPVRVDKSDDVDFVHRGRTWWHELAGGRRPGEITADRPIKWAPDASLTLEDYGAEPGTRHQSMQLYVEVERHSRRGTNLLDRLMTSVTRSMVAGTPPITIAKGIFLVFGNSEREAKVQELLRRWVDQLENMVFPLATTTITELQRTGFFGPVWLVGPDAERGTIEKAMEALCPHVDPELGLSFEPPIPLSAGSLSVDVEHHEWPHPLGPGIG